MNFILSRVICVNLRFGETLCSFSAGGCICDLRQLEVTFWPTCLPSPFSPSHPLPAVTILNPNTFLPYCYSTPESNMSYKLLTLVRPMIGHYLLSLNFSLSSSV
ncbi:hypothetical protein J6590_027227 [Homalodisca vitripennis]|nr:hypothetical protein J6590_027227 [Homalodisca vitripennis]